MAHWDIQEPSLKNILYEYFYYIVSLKIGKMVINKMATSTFLTAKLFLVFNLLCNLSIFVPIIFFKCALCPLNMD